MVQTVTTKGVPTQSTDPEFHQTERYDDDIWQCDSLGADISQLPSSLTSAEAELDISQLVLHGINIEPK